MVKLTTISILFATAGLSMALTGCERKEVVPRPALGVAETTPPTPPTPTSQTAPSSAVSTDPDNPTPLPAKKIKGVGIKQSVSYYYALNSGIGTIKITATAKNSPSSVTQALTFGLYDLKGNKLCSESHGNTTSDKTIMLNCQIEKAQPLILRLDLSEETIDYAVALDGPVELAPPKVSSAAQPIFAGPGSTDIDEPTHLRVNRIKGKGIKKPVSYYYTFNAGPGELTVTGDGKNAPSGFTDALRVGLYTLRAEQLCELSLGNTTLDKRAVMTCKIDKRQPVILRLDLSEETIDYRVKFDGPYDFE